MKILELNNKKNLRDILSLTNHFWKNTSYINHFRTNNSYTKLWSVYDHSDYVHDFLELC